MHDVAFYFLTVKNVNENNNEKLPSNDEAGQVEPEVTVESESSKHTPRIRRSRVLSGLLVIALVFVTINLFSYSEFVYLTNGPAPLVTITGEDVKYPIDGSYRFTTVLAVQAKNYEALYKEFLKKDNLYHFVNEKSLGQTDTEMEESKNTAKVLALNITSNSIIGVGNGVTVNNVVDNSPAMKMKINIGDTIIEVNGVVVHNTGELVDQLGSESKKVELKVIRNKSITMLEGTSNNEGKLGIGVVTSFRQNNVKLDFSTEDVGGGSAGLLFTLAAIDVLTPGSLTMGKIISGTGAITSDGRVGPIEGVKLKYVGAQKASANVFFVPKENWAELKGTTTKLPIIKVSNILDAVVYLCDLGSDDAICQKLKSTDNSKIGNGE